MDYYELYYDVDNSNKQTAYDSYKQYIVADVVLPDQKGEKKEKVQEVRQS